MKNAFHFVDFLGPLISNCSKLFSLPHPFFTLETVPSLTLTFKYAVQTYHFLEFSFFDSELAFESIDFSFLFILLKSGPCLEFLDLLIFDFNYFFFSFIVSLDAFELGFEGLILLLDEVEPVSKLLDLLSYGGRVAISGMVFFVLLLETHLALVWQAVSSQAGGLKFPNLLLQILVFLPEGMVLIRQPLNHRPFLSVRMFQLIYVLFELFNAVVLFVTLEGQVLYLGALTCYVRVVIGVHGLGWLATGWAMRGVVCVDGIFGSGG